jgi:two-component system, CitB family, sensor kinase
VSASVRRTTPLTTALGSHRAPSWRKSIATQLFLAVLAVVLLVTTIASMVLLRANRVQVEQLSGERALAVARSVAALPEVRSAFSTSDPAATIQPIAEAIRIRSGADFVVVANRAEIRYSHPDPQSVGKKLSTPAGDVLLGKEFVGTERGSLGVSVRGKTPILDESGDIVGLVSVGLLIEGVQARARADLLKTISYLGSGALILGGLGAGLVARRVRRQTFSLDAESIGALLEHREAILSSVKEGVIAVDLDRNISLANAEALRLLGLPPNCVGSRIDSFGLDAEVVAAIVEPTNEVDRAVGTVTGLLISNRRPISIRGVERGAIVSLRDRTELDRLNSELAGTRAATDTLRAQAHEFSNKLHTIGGLLALGAYDEVASFVDQVGQANTVLAQTVAARITDLRVAALLVAKMTLAAERNIVLTLDDVSHLRVLSEVEASDLLVVVGNLVDNAFQAIDHTGLVSISIVEEQGAVVVRVVDSGPGVKAADGEDIFGAGWSTKSPSNHSGLGLSLARSVCLQRQGTLKLISTRPTAFEAVIPLADAAWSLTTR